MVIRKAEKHDLNSIFSLICELEESELDRYQFSTVYLNNLNDKNVYYIVAEQSEAIVGFISVHIQRLLHHAGSIAEIQELIVTKQRQGKGIGHMLFKEAENIAIANECINVEVCCNRMREESHAFYEKIGMKKSHFKFTLQINPI